MTQNSSSQKKLKAAVYGSGVSGLLAAYAFHKKGVEVDIVDPYGEVILQSLVTDDGVVELAANSILSNPEIESLLQDIELQAVPYSKIGRKKFVFKNGKAKRWPLSFWSSLKSLPALYSLASKKDKMKPSKGESLQEWGERVLTEDLLENLIKPGLQGVYGYDTGEVSASLALKNLFSEKKKSKFRGSVSFSKGMGQFVASLRDYLQKNGVEFKTDDLHQNYDFKIVATPAHSLPDCVSSQNKEILTAVEYKAVSIATFIIDKKERLDIEGFGCVFKNQEEGALGLILNSDLFARRAKYGQVSETWIFDGRRVKTQYEMEKAVFKIRREGFGKSTPTKTVYFKHWPKAFPHYSVKLEEILESLDQKEDKVFFFANWTGDLGIGSMAKSVGLFADRVVRALNDSKKMKMEI